MSTAGVRRWSAAAPPRLSSIAVHGAGARPVSTRSVFLAVLLVLALIVPVACGDAGSGDDSTGSGDALAGSAEAPKAGGTYNYPLQGDPGSFDPMIQQPGDGYAVLHQMYEGLVRYEEQADGSVVTAPCLAESWSANADARVWTFRLRRGVLFHPPVSREFTAADVVADLRYIAAPERRSQIAYMLVGIKGVDGQGYATGEEFGVEAVDRYTVRFTLKHPFSEFPDTLGTGAFWVWPADHLKKVGSEAYARHPVGTGPYLFRKWDPGVSIDLVRNPQWWDTSGGPYIDTLHYEVFSSITSMMLAFQKGEIDWTYVPKGQIPASRSLPQVTSGQWKAASSPILALGYLCVNMKDPVVGGDEGLPFRQALAYACDRQAAIDAAGDSVHLLPAGLVPSGVPGAGQVADPYPYDPEKARALLAETGPVTLEVLHPIDRFGRSIAESLTGSYADVGITLEPRAVEWETYLDRLLDGDMQLFLLGWVADYPSMDNFLFVPFESESSGSSLCTFYSEPDVDALLRRARAAPDRGTRVRLYAEAERLILADAPVVPILVYADYRLENNRVAGVAFSSMAWVDLWRAWVR